MELSEARERLARWTECESETVDAIFAAYEAEKARADAATQEAQQQRERAERAEGERDHLIENYSRGFVVPCGNGWHGAYYTTTDATGPTVPWKILRHQGRRRPLRRWPARERSRRCQDSLMKPGKNTSPSVESRSKIENYIMCCECAFLLVRRRRSCK